MAFATGPIIPISLAWYLLSNYLCANAVYLYPTKIPTVVKVVCWTGLMGGGIDHIIEAYQWYTGFNRQPFGHHWTGMEWIPIFCFALTSIIGIFAVVLEFALIDQKATLLSKALVLVTFFMGIYWESTMQWQFEHSGFEWHYGHIFAAHLFLSMMPAYIVWYSRKYLGLMSIPFFSAAKEPDLKLT